MQIIRVGVDLAKNVFQVHGVDARERTVWQKSLKRSNWLSELQRCVPVGAEIGFEACSGAHHWGRQLVARGYQVKLMAPQFVKPYVKSNKSDRNDAISAATTDAGTRATAGHGSRRCQTVTVPRYLTSTSISSAARRAIPRRWWTSTVTRCSMSVWGALKRACTAICGVCRAKTTLS